MTVEVDPTVTSLKNTAIRKNRQQMEWFPQSRSINIIESELTGGDTEMEQWGQVFLATHLPREQEHRSRELGSLILKM